MSLDVTLRSVTPRPCEHCDGAGSIVESVYDANITHNLVAMAREAGIYMHLWRPEEIGITTAAQLVEPLRAGLALMRGDPSRFEAHDAPNGWGTYGHFVPWVARYLAACEAHPDATVEACR